jgi:steroid 5-alpha reductase family enzyme
MPFNWKEFEFFFLLMILFGFIISLSNASGFVDFPKNMTINSWLGLILLVVGVYGVYNAEK